MTGVPVNEQAERRADKVIVRVIVQRQVLEARADVDGFEDYYVIRRDLVSEREWVEDRDAALGVVEQPVTAEDRKAAATPRPTTTRGVSR